MYDTNWHYSDCTGFIHIFPIFDTSYDASIDTIPHQSDTCHTPYNLNKSHGGTGTATLTWEDPQMAAWELKIHKENDATYAEDAFFQTSNRYLSIEGLDTAAWYIANVRTKCDSTNYSEWSDSLRFYVFGQTQTNPDDTTHTDPPTPPDSVGIQTLATATPQVDVFPNPTKGAVLVQCVSPMSKVELFTHKGTLIKELAPSSNNVELNLGSLSRGLYLVRVTTEHGVAVKKIIKE